ncbi:MAG: hypothetical protein J6T10_30110 [Methanobrevibacter sp.]|nr:hypothetical protein [Methanobrevibacter sp.]
MIEDIEAYRPHTTVVFFGGNKTHWWTRLLKKGYYHCFIAMDIGCRKWVLIDPVMNYTDFIVVQNDNYFIKTVADKGYTYIITEPKFILNRKKWHIRPFTCVEVVKNFLGITKPFIFTPYQLYKHIKKESK